MAALQREHLKRLCSNSETLEKAESILRLANAKTRPGSGFVVKNPIGIPAVCAYLASEEYASFLLAAYPSIRMLCRLNTSEVSLRSAVSAACVSKAEFSDILKKLRSVIGAEKGDTVTNLTYEVLVHAHHVRSGDRAIACMEDAEAVLPHVDVLKGRYGANVVSCAIFYWVCQLMEVRSTFIMENTVSITVYRNPRYKSDPFVKPTR